MDYLRTINRNQLRQMMDEQQDFVLIDILPPEYYEEVHLPGAINACVFDVDFATQVEGFVPDRNKFIVVYCNSATSRAPEIAMQKLDIAGYTGLHIYKGGTIDWRRAGNPVEGTRPDKVFAPRVEDRVYAIDTAQSVVEWIGRNLTGSHYGAIGILSGSIPVKRGLPVSASFLLDVNSITNFDVQDPTLNSVLIAHLKSDDFFDVANFPTASFDATSFKPVDGAKPGAVNFQITGKLAMKGITREITFPAVITLRDDGIVVAEAHFDIDRTLWNINYGTGKFFEKLGRHLVYDIITLQLKLVAV